MDSVKSRSPASGGASSIQPSGTRPIERVTTPFQEFSEKEATGGVLLLVAAAVALAWANSPWAASYFTLWEHKFTIGFEDLALSMSIVHWTNDGLMAIFFFAVGLEIKRELLAGELASPRQAALPIAGALGGVLVPAFLYYSLNASGPGAAGWGIPMATDIAFAVGAMALLGSRLPVGLKVFLTALAIVDDIVAVLVIAIFYTNNISWISLGVAAGFFAVLLIANKVGVRHPLPFALLGFCIWVAMLHSGVHPTMAGILAALATPAHPQIDVEKFIARGYRLLDQMENPEDREEHILRSEARKAAVVALEEACEKVETPLQRFEHMLLPWVRLIIMPTFALANAGVALGSGTAAATSSISIGIVLGLVVGKPIGISCAAWLAVRSGLASLPAQVGWRQILGVGTLGGIGFTVSIFIASVAFAEQALLDVAKLGIFVGSLVAGCAGLLLLLKFGRA
jgi:Na+:H+ antiporter, NhaA family